MDKFKSFYFSDWGHACERTARVLAVAIVATYAAGYAAGRTLHRWNDQLASLVTGRKPAPTMIRQRQAAAIATPSAAISAPPLAGLTVIELRQMARAAGHRKLARSGRKADLLAVLA